MEDPEQVARDEAFARQLQAQYMRGWDQEGGFAMGEYARGGDVEMQDGDGGVVGRGGARAPGAFGVGVGGERRPRNALERWLTRPRRYTRASAMLSACAGTVDMIVTFSILLAAWSSPCDKPMRVWLAIFSARWLVMLPVQFRIAAFERAGRNHTREDTWMGYAQLCTLLWFVVGQMWLFSSSTCKSTNSTLYYYCLAQIIIVYMILFSPLVILVTLVLCLPCLIIHQRLRRRARGASNVTLDALPRHEFVPFEDPPNDDEGLPPADTTAGDTGGDAKDRQRRLRLRALESRLGLGGDLSGLGGSGPDDSGLSEDLGLDSKRSAGDGKGGGGEQGTGRGTRRQSENPSCQINCAICYCEYEQGDVLVTLPCKHVFHDTCATKWLKMKQICPLCRMDISAQPPDGDRARRGSHDSLGDDIDDPEAALM